MGDCRPQREDVSRTEVASASRDRHVDLVNSYNDPKKVLSLHSILIQSPLLKDLLKDVLEGYPGVTVGLKRLEFSGRFEPLIHRWAELTAAIEKLRQKVATSSDADSTDNDRVQHAELLHDLLAKEFKETIEASTDLKEKGVMTYEHLWTLFQPSAHVYSRQMSQDRIFKLHSSKYGEDIYGLQTPLFLDFVVATCH